MKRVLYIISVLICVACSEDIFSEQNLGVLPQPSSQINPSAYVDSPELPPAATKAMINVSTVGSMEANMLRIDENKDGSDNGLYTFGSWENAYLVEANVASPTPQGLRSMALNPVQAYSYKVDRTENDTTFYHTRMISWYPRTCNLYKNDEGKAATMHLSDFEAVDPSAYDTDEGVVTLNFKNLDGSKDVMVSNIVEGQHWHTYDGTESYTYPFGQNDSKPTYTNIMTYKHYLTAVKIYAYAQDSDQVVSMWGAIRKVIMKNQPSQVSVNLPSPDEMRDATVANHVQTNSLDYGNAVFSGNTEFSLIKTPMFGAESNGFDEQEIADDNPYLVPDDRIYLGYAMIKPSVELGQKLEFDVHTDAGVLSLSVDMDGYFLPGYIYTIDVNFNTSGAIADIVLKAGEEHYYDLSAHEELSETVSDYRYANCYIISPDIKRTLSGGGYTYYDGYAFSATTIGSATAQLHPEFASDRTTKAIEPVRAGLLWESSPGLITQVEYLYGYIRFRVQPPQVKNGENWVDNGDYKEGNAVIAAYDSQRKVLWSWHIWVTDKPNDVEYTITSGSGNKQFTLLDRNLGATASNTSNGSLLETYGLYYQWGRKDPSMGPPSAVYPPQSTETAPYYDYYGMEWKYSGVVTKDRPGIRDGVENPMYLLLPTDFSMTTYQYDWMYTSVDNLWGDYSVKTIYDPCPFDYMVPQDEISTLFAFYSSTLTRTSEGMTINNSFFPYAGYKGVDKGVSSLSAAWRHVGDKGDYMSAKIDDNKHRSRTYISNVIPWTEYGADSDGDGDGDASRTYNSYVYADDQANRRTAASVRCVKMHYGLDASLRASFVGDKAYAFVGEGEQINFAYSVTAQGTGVSIASAYIELTENDPILLTTLPAGGTSISGNYSCDIPDEVGEGIARYRLVSTGSNGVISRVSHALRLFDLTGLEINDVAYTEDLTVTPGQTYGVSFTLVGLESDFTVLVNGAVAEKGTVTYGQNGLATMNYEVPANPGISIPGHLHIQIINAEGNIACEKSYEVKQNASIEVIYTVDVANKITDVTKLEAGKPYFFRLQTMYYSNYYCFVYKDGKLSWQKCTHDCKLIVDDVQNQDAVVPAANVFYYHKDDTKIYNLGYSRQSAGALFSPAANGFLKDDFTFGQDNEAVYVTCANPSSYNTYAQLYSSVTGDQLYYDPDAFTYKWGWLAIAYPSKWEIYPVIVTTNN